MNPLQRKPKVTEESKPEGTVLCTCGGSGTFYGRGLIENGVFKGYTGTCYGCGGKGYQTKDDVARNLAYWRHNLKI